MLKVNKNNLLKLLCIKYNKKLKIVSRKKLLK
jgi:hypothetical protein